MDPYSRQRKGCYAGADKRPAGSRGHPSGGNDNFEMENVAAVERHPKEVWYVTCVPSSYAYPSKLAYVYACIGG